MGLDGVSNTGGIPINGSASASKQISSEKLNSIELDGVRNTGGIPMNGSASADSFISVIAAKTTGNITNDVETPFSGPVKNDNVATARFNSGYDGDVNKIRLANNAQSGTEVFYIT